MAGGTSNAFCYVNAVIEVNKLREVVNPFPLDRLVFAKARSDGLEIRLIGEKLAMTIHAGLRWGHTCCCRGLNSRVAVATIDAVIADVVLMAELNRLLLFQISAGEI